MSDMIERYVHQVGRYLPQKERAEIEAELRSQINDQLEDRYGGAATAEEVRAALVELGDPRQLAASYGSEQYLIGPNLYPVMMSVLRAGWMIVPLVVVIVHAVLALFALGEESLVRLVLNAIAGVIQAMFIFTAVVVMLFAMFQHSGADIGEFTSEGKAFDPDDLPEVDQPGAVDRFESAFSITFHILAAIILLYFLWAGGLTIRLSLTDPGPVIPVPVPWLVALILATVAELGLVLIVVRRGRWTIGTRLLETLLELLGAVAAWFVIMRPLFEFGLRALPELGDIPFIDRSLQMFLAFIIIVVLISGTAEIVKLALGKRRG